MSFVRRRPGWCRNAHRRRARTWARSGCITVDEPDPHEAYAAFQEGTRLLGDDNAHAAVIALEHARELERDESLERGATHDQDAQRDESDEPC